MAIIKPGPDFLFNFLLNANNWTEIFNRYRYKQLLNINAMSNIQINIFLQVPFLFCSALSCIIIFFLPHCRTTVRSLFVMEIFFYLSYAYISLYFMRKTHVKHMLPLRMHSLLAFTYKVPYVNSFMSR